MHDGSRRLVQILARRYALCCNPALALEDRRRDDRRWPLWSLNIAAAAIEQPAPQDSLRGNVTGGGFALHMIAHTRAGRAGVLRQEPV